MIKQKKRFFLINNLIKKLKYVTVDYYWKNKFSVIYLSKYYNIFKKHIQENKMIVFCFNKTIQLELIDNKRDSKIFVKKLLLWNISTFVNIHFSHRFKTQRLVLKKFHFFLIFIFL